MTDFDAVVAALEEQGVPAGMPWITGISWLAAAREEAEAELAQCLDTLSRIAARSIDDMAQREAREALAR